MEPQKYGPPLPSPSPVLAADMVPQPAHSNYKRSSLSSWTPSSVNGSESTTSVNSTPDQSNYKMIVTPAHWHPSPPGPASSSSSTTVTDNPVVRLRHSTLFTAVDDTPAFRSQVVTPASNGHMTARYPVVKVNNSGSGGGMIMQQARPSSVRASSIINTCSYQMTGGDVRQVIIIDIIIIIICL